MFDECISMCVFNFYLNEGETAVVDEGRKEEKESHFTSYFIQMGIKNQLLNK